MNPRILLNSIETENTVIYVCCAWVCDKVQCEEQYLSFSTTLYILIELFDEVRAIIGDTDAEAEQNYKICLLREE